MARYTQPPYLANKDRDIVNPYIFLSALLLAVTWQPAHALEQGHAAWPALRGLSMGVGLEYETGDYGTGDTTDLWRLPLSISYSGEQWYFNATIPYLIADSTGAIVVRSDGHHTTGGIVSGGRSEHGIGDVTLSATRYLTYDKERKLEPFVRGRIKLGTADENKGLGTGENDVAAEIGLNKWTDKQRYYGAIGYEVVGDPPGVNYDNVFYGYGGMSFELTKDKHLGVDLYYTQASAPGFDDSLDLTGFVNYRYDRQRTIHVYLLAGLADGSPDWGGGVNLRYYFLK
jgi:hypothetical protein